MPPVLSNYIHIYELDKKISRSIMPRTKRNLVNTWEPIINLLSANYFA